MTKTNHTPAPWRLSENMRGIGNNAVYGVETSDGFGVANCGTKADKRNLANARLIAKAPAMHAALAQIARMRMDGEGVDDDGDEFVLENDDAVDSLHSCIRLAREALAGV